MDWKSLPYIFSVTPTVSGFAMAYSILGLVADEVMPRIDNMNGKDAFKMLIREPGDAMRSINDRVGRRSEPKEIEFTGREATDSCEVHALQGFVGQDDIINSDQSKYESLVNREQSSVLETITLQRELRVIKAVQDPSNYANVLDMTFAQSLLNPDAKPLELIGDYMLKCLMRPNQLRMGASIWHKLRTHPNVIKEVYGAASTKGFAVRADIAAVLEIDKVIVGDTKVNSAAKGQDNKIITAWGETISGAYVNAQATRTEGCITWGFTAQNGPRFVKLVLNEKKGGRGGVDVMVGEVVKEVVAAKDCGFLLSNVLAPST